jgi:hypothetical protein
MNLILPDPLQAMLACCAEVDICRDHQRGDDKTAAMVGEMDQWTELRRLIVIAKLGVIARALQGNDFHFNDEHELQNGISIALAEARINAQREALIGKGSESRVDFLIGRIALEVKVGGSLAEVMRQLDRYAHCDGIDAVMLVTSRLRHKVSLPMYVNNKPLQVMEIVRL